MLWSGKPPMPGSSIATLNWFARSAGVAGSTSGMSVEPWFTGVF
jgi:hypothetical protein